MQVKKRDLGGRITRAHEVYVWVPFSMDGNEEIGLWLGITKTQAREITAAAGEEESDVEILEISDDGGLYIGFGPEPVEDDGEGAEDGAEEEVAEEETAE